MTLNISEANALNRVINHLAGLSRPGSGEPFISREQAIDDLALLARGASKTLHAGHSQTSAHEALTKGWAAHIPAAELTRLRSMAQAHEKCMATVAEREYVSGSCEDCFCCTNQLCAEGSCPTNSLGESTCPCTGE
jgi:hypothetical protein